MGWGFVHHGGGARGKGDGAAGVLKFDLVLGGVVGKGKRDFRRGGSK